MLNIPHRVLWWGLTTAVTIILGMGTWGLSIMSHAIQRNTDHALDLEHKIADLANETKELRIKLDYAIEERRREESHRK